MKSEGGEEIKFRFCDTMGLEEGDKGLQVHDLVPIMDGNIEDMTEVHLNIP